MTMTHTTSKPALVCECLTLSYANDVNESALYHALKTIRDMLSYKQHHLDSNEEHSRDNSADHSMLTVLKDLSFEIASGAFLAVVGPSGCGKSTLLHAIAGFIRPTRGSVRLGEMLIVEPTSQIGYVGQSYALFPWLTVENNIAFGLRPKKLGQHAQRLIIDHFLEVIGLTQYRDSYPRQLSGGMQQRVALARAMAPDPRVLLLDEPFSALDPENRRNMRDLLLQLWKDQGTTIVFVTHDVEEGLLLADEMLLLKQNSGTAKSIKIPFPRPRADGLARTSEFARLLALISDNH